MRQAAVIGTVALWLASSTGVAAQEASVVTGTKHRMDIAVTRYLLDGDGKPVGPPAQTIRYQFARVKTDRGWHTTLTLAAPDGASRDEVARNPFFGGRLEFDSTGAFTLFDNNGRTVPVPDRRGATGMAFSDEWSDSLQIIDTAASMRHARLRDIEAKYGQPAGRIRGLSQYLRKTGDGLEELLFDEARSVPVELSIMRGDVLQGRVAFEYVEVPGRGLLRRRTRSEARVTDDGHRMVTLAEFSSVVVEGER